VAQVLNRRDAFIAFVLIFALALPAQAALRCQNIFAARDSRLEPQHHADLLPRIQSSELANLKWEAPEPGFFIGDFNGLPVIGKKLPKEDSQNSANLNNLTSFEREMAIRQGMIRSSFDEALWLKDLNDMGLGAKLYGIARIKNDQYMVMERIDGYNTNRRYFPKVDIPVSAVKEMERQYLLLISNGIIPRDLQFQISHDGQRVVLVDPEFFERGSLTPRASELFWEKFLYVLKEDFNIVR